MDIPWQVCRTIGPLLSQRFPLASAKAQPRGGFLSFLVFYFLIPTWGSIIFTACPSNCEVCVYSGTETVCNTDKCDAYYAQDQTSSASNTRKLCHSKLINSCNHIHTNVNMARKCTILAIQNVPGIFGGERLPEPIYTGLGYPHNSTAMTPHVLCGYYIAWLSWADPCHS